VDPRSVRGRLERVGAKRAETDPGNANDSGDGLNYDIKYVRQTGPSPAFRTMNSSFGHSSWLSWVVKKLSLEFGIIAALDGNSLSSRTTT
jgi:hypothetical protein